MIVLGLLSSHKIMLAQSSAGYKIVVNSSNSLSSMGKKEISKMFYKKTSKWSDGKMIFPVELFPESPVRIIFNKDIHGKKVSSVKAYWKKQIFSGRGVQPQEKKADLEVLDYIQNNPGAIGYVSTTTKLGNFKVKELKIK